MTLRQRMRHVRSLLPAVALCAAAALTPYSASADTDLTLEANAVVAHANGDAVNVRSGPGAGEPILTEVPEGNAVWVHDGVFWAEDGSAWYQVEASGVVGYMIADYLATAGGVGGPSGDAMASEQVYVRSGPSTADPILANLQGGDWVTLAGESSNGFHSVYWGDYIGWVYAEYLTTEGSAAAAEPVAEAPAAATGTRYTLDSVNLRVGAGLDSGVIDVMPAGTELSLTGNIGNGFAEVNGAYGSGWVSAEYLGADAPAAEAAPAAPAPKPAGSLITWPVSGGEWSFLQGYNGSSHYNSGLWQYQDSIDLVRTDGATAGEPVYSPVNGTVRWFDPATGGVSIDMGNGYAFALFHAYYDEGLQEGDTVVQGQYIGTIAPAGQAAAGGTPHLHIAVWATEDGGNWSRQSVPFTGQLAIAGNEYHNSGAGLEHTGTIVNP